MNAVPRKRGPRELGLVLRAKLAHQASVRAFGVARKLGAAGEWQAARCWRALGWIQHETALAALNQLPADSSVAL